MANNIVVPQTNTTPNPSVSSVPIWVWFIYFVIGLIILFIGIAINISSNNSTDSKTTDNKVSVPETTVLPEYFTKTYHLKKGDNIKVDIPSGYDYSYGGNGVPYFIKVNGFDWVLVGPGLTKPDQDGEELKFCHISFYKKDATAIFYFKKY